MAHTTDGGIDYVELDGGPSGSFDEQGLRISRRFQVAWADTFGFIQEVMGLITVTGHSTVAAPGIPFPNFPNCFPTSCDFEPQQPTSPLGTRAASDDVLGDLPNTYTNSVVTVQYASTFSQDPVSTNLNFSEIRNIMPAGTYLQYDREFGGEGMSLPKRAWYWGSVAAANLLQTEDDIEPWIILPSGQHTITWFWVADPPWAAIEERIGKVNSAAFIGQPAETMLFLGATPTMLFRTQADEVVYRLIYRFAGSSKFLVDNTTKVGWNHFFRKAASGENWQKIVDKDAAAVYDTTDFLELFKYANP